MDRCTKVFQVGDKEALGAANPGFNGEVAIPGALGGSLHRKESYVGR